jgi:hypothetical protein
MGSKRTRSLYKIIISLVFFSSLVAGFLLIPSSNEEDVFLANFIKEKDLSYTDQLKPDDFMSIIRLRRIDAIEEAIEKGEDEYRFIVEVDRHKGG